MKSVRKNYDKKLIILQRKTYSIGRFDNNNVEIWKKAIFLCRKGVLFRCQKGVQFQPRISDMRPSVWWDKNCDTLMCRVYIVRKPFSSKRSIHYAAYYRGLEKTGKFRPKKLSGSFPHFPDFSNFGFFSRNTKIDTKILNTAYYHQ